MTTEKQMIGKLTELFKTKDYSTVAVEYIGSALDNPSDKVKCKALWVIGELGLQHPEVIHPYVPTVAGLLTNENSTVRERAANAIGRIGRADFSLIEPYWQKLFDCANDASPNVRLMFIWASENIATTSPHAYSGYMDIFARLLDDTDTRVRIESPEIFRVIGKRTPKEVLPFINKLKYMADNDSERVVRIHSAGAIKTTNTHLSDGKAKEKTFRN